MPNQASIFDSAARARHRDRAAPHFDRYDFLYHHCLEELLDRLELVQRPLQEVLLIGCPTTLAKSRLEAKGKSVICTDAGFAFSAHAAGVQADEDALPFADGSFDLIIACGTLDSVNDLPGAFALMHRILRPDGLLLAAFCGAPSLGHLRAALLSANSNRPAPHIHPQIELRSAGDLLQRAGFALPVVDCDTITARYSSIFALMTDLRGMGASNAMVGRTGSLSRPMLAQAAAYFASKAESDGKTSEDFNILYLSAWKPDPSQPKPAKRGSATVSLAEALAPKNSGS